MTQSLQRLAFRVQPEREETFDSWLYRLLVRHQVNLRELLRHLGCDERLTGEWMGGGHKNVRAPLRDSYDHFLETVAWAVDCQKLSLVKSIIPTPSAYLLPPGCQNYSCPVCWMETLSDNRPIVIQHRWAYKLSWFCHGHDVPLVPIGPLRKLRTTEAQRDYLSDMIGITREWIARVRVLRRAKAWNRECVALLTLNCGPEDQRDRDVTRYFDYFAQNRFHFSTVRIRLMALAHRVAHSEALRFEQLLDASDQSLNKRRVNIMLSNKSQASRSDEKQPLTLLMKQSSKTYDVNLANLLMAYTAVSQRSPVLREHKPRYSDHELNVLHRSALKH